MSTLHIPLRDNVSRYLGNSATEDTSLWEHKAIKYGILLDMYIELSDDEVKYLFSLPTVDSVNNWCHTIMMNRLGETPIRRRKIYARKQK
jgi:hypothetical protein